MCLLKTATAIGKMIIWVVRKLKALPSVWVGTCLLMGLFVGGLLQIVRAHCHLPFQRSAPPFLNAASHSSQCYLGFYLLFCVTYFLQINMKLD